MSNQTHLQPDLHISAYLLTRGFPLLRLERVGRRYAFVFESSPEIQAAVREFRAGASVVARDFVNAIARLKSELFAQKFEEKENRFFSETFKDDNEHEQCVSRS